ncbi:MAG: hypothetical protein O7B99_04985, partial [Planctomycetota bacterium]|nr:hypothetical protein [Planctomycetota bacterium]
MMPFATVLLAVLAPFSAPQDPGEIVTSKKILLQLGDVVLQHYEPRHVSTEELLFLVSEMVGREFFVQERGGFLSPPVQNLSMLGDRLIIYDSKAYLDQVLETVRQLDQPSEKKDGLSEPLQTTEYVPRYLSLSSVDRALEPYRTQIAVDMPNRRGRVSYR